MAIDVTEEAQVEEMADAAVASFSRLDVLVAAAGISHDARGELRPPLLELPTEAWQRLLDVNLTGVMLCNRAAAKRMVWMLTRGLALELAPYGIRVNAIGPGLIASPMTYGYFRGEEGVSEMGAELASTASRTID